MKDYNIVNIIKRVKESNWVENEPINVSLSKSNVLSDIEKKTLRKISFGKDQELEIILNDEHVLVRNICYCEEEDMLYAEIYTRTVYTDFKYTDNKIIPFSDLKEKHIIMISEKLFNKIPYDYQVVRLHFSEFMNNKFEKYKNRIKCLRVNFIFLDDNTFIYDYSKFTDHIEAIYTASLYGENIKELISLIYPEKIDQEPVYQKIINGRKK